MGLFSLDGRYNLYRGKSAFKVNMVLPYGIPLIPADESEFDSNPVRSHGA